VDFEFILVTPRAYVLAVFSQWTAATCDGKASAQFEETLLITPEGVEVLTAAPGWVLPVKKADVVEMEKPSNGMGGGGGGKKRKGKK